MSSSPESTSDGRQAEQPYYVREGEECGSGILGRPWHHLFARDGEDECRIGAFATEELAGVFRDTLEDLQEFQHINGGLFFSEMRRAHGDLVSHLKKGFFEVSAHEDFDCWCFEYGIHEFAQIRDVGSFLPYLFFRELTRFDWAEKHVCEWTDECDRVSRERHFKKATETPAGEQLLRYLHKFEKAYGAGILDDDLGCPLDCWDAIGFAVEEFRGRELPAGPHEDRICVDPVAFDEWLETRKTKP